MLQQLFPLETIDAGCDAAAASRHDRVVAMLPPKFGGSAVGVGDLLGLRELQSESKRRGFASEVGACVAKQSESERALSAG